MQRNEDKDINDVFDDLLFVEDHVIKEGYQEGFSKGCSQGNPEGFHLGYHRGAEIGAELGYYLSVSESFLTSKAKITISDKAQKNLLKIVSLISNFPKQNTESIDIIAEFDKIKTLFKKICALLKIDAAFPEVDELSF